MHESWQRAERWFVGRYVIMPDHVHLFCAPAVSVPESLHRRMGFWKAGDAPVAASRRTADLAAPFLGYAVTPRRNYSAKWDYVVANPVRPGLVSQSEDWPYQGEMNVLTW